MFHPERKMKSKKIYLNQLKIFLMQLILLSAGRGSRLSKELRSKPKSLAKSE